LDKISDFGLVNVKIIKKLWQSKCQQPFDPGKFTGKNRKITDNDLNNYFFQIVEGLKGTAGLSFGWRLNRSTDLTGVDLLVVEIIF